ncbi:Synaptonemal complex protein 1 [Galemys pyrenaicus]|uniref:Synaptonemal complex protein 1 n=1 Tax=Galemys pyrenaicus TaxID=202257 RepID=A0A8J6AI56_GALPY|nr:Synaptonemal complex protein 1 [Galemys pyrenaicus]
MANTYVTAPDGCCLAEQEQYYEQINYQLHDTDFQELPHCHYSTVQFPSGLPSPSLQRRFDTYNLNLQFSGGEYGLGYCELNKPTYMVALDAEDGYPGIKRSRLTHSSIQIKGQEELCVVCGDRASGYHYNALTCEGCKGKHKLEMPEIPVFTADITKNAVYRCKNGGHCEMDMYMRRKCQECRLKKCKAVGMLAECLLTEIQCKSKRLRKIFKQNSCYSNIRVEDEGADKVVSSGKMIQESVELTQEEYQLINNIVVAHQKYTVALEETEKFEYANPELSFLQLSETVVLHTQGLMDFTKGLPGFENLTKEDQTALCKESKTEVMFLHVAQLYSQKEGLSSTSEHAKGIAEEFITTLFYFYKRMSELNITNTEYALLAATIVFFSVANCNEEKMEKQKSVKLFVPPRLSSQVSAVKPHHSGGESNFFKNFSKCIEDDFGFPFVMTNLSKNGENNDSDSSLQKVSFLPMLEQVDNSDSNQHQEAPKESDFENSEPMSRLYSKLYKEAEKIKKWKVNVESELKQKESKLQENRKIIEAQRKAIQELQLNVIFQKMIVAFEELRVQAENSRLDMHFKCRVKEDYEKIQHLEEEYKKEVDDKEKQVSLLLLQSTEKENKMKDLTFLLEESRVKVNQLEEKTKLQNENLKESNEKQDHLTCELEDLKMSLQRSVSTQKALEEDLQIATKKIYQLTGEKEAQMEEFNKAKAAHAFVVTELKSTINNLKELLTAEQQGLEKSEDQLKILTVELEKKSSELEEMTNLKINKEVEIEELKEIVVEHQNLLEEKTQFEKIIEELKGTEQELTSLLQTREKKVHDLEIKLTIIGTSEQHYSKQVKELKTVLENEKNELETVREELKRKGDEVKCKLDKSEENCNNLRKQVENKSKHIEELQQENKALKKKGTAESKQLNVYEIKVSKLELDLEGAKQKFKEMTDSYQKEIEEKKILEKNLLGEVQKAQVIAEEAVKLQKEIDIRCQHKIAEMVALMEKHKHQYDKIVEERDSELGLYKSKEQEHSSMKASLEIELSNLKSELSSMKKQLEIEREEKEKLKREANKNTVTLKEKKDKKTQTSLLEMPETSYWKFDSKAAPSQNMYQNFTSSDHGKSKDKRDSQWTSAKSTSSTSLPKAYTVKTPTKLKSQQREDKNVAIEENNKKRKMVFEFDINSDSSETADLLSMVSEEETLKKLYKNNNPPTSHLCVRTPKKTPSSLTTPGPTLKFGTMRKMQEDRWAAIAKMDRKKKLKEAEKLFV